MKCIQIDIMYRDAANYKTSDFEIFSNESGFASDYELVRNQADKKKFIGNSVEVTTAKKLFEAHYTSLRDHLIEVQQVT